MIDTIILRIHNVNKYSNLIRSMDMLDIKGHTTEMGRVKGSDIRNLRRQGHKKGADIIEILKLQGKGEFLIKTKYAKHMNASSHYSLAYCVNYTADFIEFNFSIPKYTYGSNVLMFVDHIYDKDYNYADCCGLEHNINRAFHRFEKFLLQFFKMEFPLIDVDYNDVEVNRIDVCFNQLFRSKEEALKYLEFQKRQRKKHARDEEGVMKDYATSLMYVTKRYSAKIYHKGSEYQKNDLNEHLKINKAKGKRYFNTQDYQAFADRMLRYELTIRTDMLKYLHRRHIFRKNCSLFQEAFKVYQKVENSKQKNDRISKKAGTVPEKERIEFLLLHPYDKISKDDRNIHKYVTQLINKRTRFMLSVDEGVTLYNKFTFNGNCDQALFSNGLLKLCLLKLVEFMLEYKIEELPPEEKISKLIDNYNSQHKKHLPKSEMLSFYKDLCSMGSFKTVAQFNYLSRATMYRYRKRFDRIGITENNLIPETVGGIPGAELDLMSYHSEHTFNPHFLRKNNFLNLL